MRYPGTLVVEFLDPLPPGLPRREFIARISAVIEDATNRLVATARQEQAQLFGRRSGVAVGDGGESKVFSSSLADVLHRLDSATKFGAAAKRRDVPIGDIVDLA